MKPIKTFDPTRHIYPNPSTRFPPLRPSGPRCASQPLLVAYPASPPSPHLMPLLDFSPQAVANISHTTPVPHRPPLAQPPRGRTPPLASHLLGRIPMPVQAMTPLPLPRLSRQTCWLYVNMCVIVKFETYLAIKLVLYSWIWTYWHVYVNTLRVPCYPAGKGKGKDSYPLRLEGKGIQEIDGYANRRVNALPLPYPAHCHP
jgi:hypothetical protein